MEYNKLAVSKTLEVKEGLGLIIELTEGKSENVLSLWLQYKDTEGQWKHKATKGASAIRVPLNKEVADFIVDSIKGMQLVNEKHVPKKSRLYILYLV